MVRAVLLGLLATSALTACKSNDPPTVQPGAVAGKVLELSGAVSVAGKPLAVGDAVSADAPVETGVDGTVVIELSHNQARWELGPNHKMKPAESLAWTLAKKTGSAAQVDQATSAAGRPAERNAAETAITSTPPAPVAAPSETRQPPEPPPPGTHTANPRSEPGAVGAVAPKSAVTTNHLVDKDDAGGGGGGEAKKMYASRSSDPKTALQQLASCLAPGSSVHIKAHIAKHKPTIAFVSDVDATVRACIRKAAPELTLEIDSGDVELTLTR